jgi:hypothetical protein
MLIYSDGKEPFRGKTTPYNEQDAVAYWARHYENYLYLDFIKLSTEYREERRQAEHEIRICQRKMDHWQRHANWNAAEAARRRAIADRSWNKA